MKNRIFILLFALCAASCANHSHQIDDLSHVFRYNESKGISSLDPAYARNQTVIWPVSQLFNGLLQMDDSLKIRPALAKSWEVSPDGKVYTFQLRMDVRFHDDPVFPGGRGRMTSAEDVEFSFSRILDPAVASPGLWVFSKLQKGDADHPKGFKALNDSTFRIWLDGPFPPFAGILTMPYCFVVPHEAVERYGKDFSRHPVGTGPFMFRMWVQDEKLVLVKNPHYFERDSSGNRLPYLDAVAVTFIKDKQSEFLEFLSGNLDFLSGVHPTYKDELLTPSGHLNPHYEGRYKLITQPYLNTEYLGFLVDTTLKEVKNSPLKISGVRKAINFGFDRRRMLRYLRNNIGEPAVKGMVPYGLPDFDHSRITGFGYNPDSARYYLEKAGFPNGKGLGEIKLTTTADYLDLCEYIQFELARLGIRLSLDVATGASFRNKVANSNLMFFRGSWIADYPDPENYLSLFYTGNFSPSGPNYTHFSDKRYDRIYNEAINSSDPSRRSHLYEEMDQMIIDHAVIVPLYYDQVVRFVPVNVSGLGSNPMNMLILKYVKKR